jgi:hypothetical protein
MEARTFGKDTYKRLKRRTDRLIDLCGGLIAASEETRAGKSSLSNYADSREHGAGANLWAPIDIIADLEAAAGEPLVTKELARLAGYELLPLAGATDGELDPMTDHCQHSVLMGKATAVALAMDADRVRAPEELKAYVEALTEARDHLQRTLDKARIELIAATTGTVTAFRAA